jgi:hypothetical protein
VRAGEVPTRALLVRERTAVRIKLLASVLIPCDVRTDDGLRLAPAATFLRTLV